MRAFVNFVYDKEEFGMDRVFCIEDEHLGEDYELSDAQYKAVRIILDEFGEDSPRKPGYRIVIFSGC